MKKLTEECGMEYVELDKEELRAKVEDIYEEHPGTGRYGRKSEKLQLQIRRGKNGLWIKEF